MTEDAQTDSKLPAPDDPQEDVEGLDQEAQRQAELDAQAKREERKAVKRYCREKQLRPYQAELIKMQQFLEQKKERMLILFEGRDASG